MGLLKKSLYEPIGAQKKHSPAWFGLLFIVFCFALYLMKHKQQSHLEMLPTILSLKDPHTRTYINALENPLYQKLDQYPIRDRDARDVARLDVTEEESSRHEPGRISWTIHGEDYRKADVLVVYKHDNLTISNILEAATFDQLWYTFGRYPIHIPSVPRLLLNDTQLAVVRGRFGHYDVVAKTGLTKFHRNTEPYHIHLAYSNSSYVVRFTTAVSGSPVVRIGDTLYKGRSFTYQNKDMCSPPANESKPGQFIDPGYLHEVHLDVDGSFTYRVGLESGQGVSWSESSYTVKQHEDDFSYIVFGDQGCPDVNGGWQVGTSWMEGLWERENNVHSVHHVGDLSYAKGAGHQWDLWLDMIEPVSAHVPWMVAVGNHEYDYFDGSSHDPSASKPYHPTWGNFGMDSGGECGVPTSKHFTMPSTGNGVFWYSYVEKLAQFIVLSSEHDLGQGSIQQEWLLKTLEQVDREKTPWLIVELHRPLYEPEKFWVQEAVAVALRDEIEFILYQYGVDAVFAGHYHAYHRSCDGLFRSKCKRGGPIHFTVGTAGARLDPGSVGVMLVPWSEQIILQTYGYGRVTIPNATHLHFEFVKMGNRTDADAGRVLDEVWVHRDR